MSNPVRRIKWRQSFLALVSVTALISAFNNCSHTQFSDQNSSDRKSTTTTIGGEGGIDGLKFVHYDLCPNGTVDVADTVVVTSDFKSAVYQRKDCSDLASPQSISTDSLSFALGSTTTFKIADRVFDQMTNAVNQRVTVAFCQVSTQPSVQALVWRNEKNPSAFVGSVIKEGGVTTGQLDIAPPTSTVFPIDYQSTPNQTSEMDLNMASAASADLTYSIFGGAQTNVTNLDCGTQRYPVAYRYAANLAAATDGYNLADISTAAELNALPSGMFGLVWLGVCNGADTAFINAVSQFNGNPMLYGFYLMDEPDPATCPAANLKAESDYIHAHFPGAKTFISDMNLGSNASPSYVKNGLSYTPANTDIDLFGINVDPCLSEYGTTSCQLGLIGAAVSAVQAAGVPVKQLVPIFPAFGCDSAASASGCGDDNNGYYFVPTASEAQQILDTYASVIPNPAFEYTWTWGQSDIQYPLSQLPALQTVFTNHNSATPP